MKSNKNKKVTNLQLVLVTSTMFGALVIGAFLLQNIYAVIFSAIITVVVILYTEGAFKKQKNQKKSKPVNVSRLTKQLLVFLLAHGAIAALVYAWRFVA